MATTYTYSGTLTLHHCPTCGVSYGLDSDYDRRRQESGEGWTAPCGHTVVYTKSEVDRLRTELKRQKDETDRAWAQARRNFDQKEIERRSHAATKGKVTKLKKRIAAGVCPACTRTFQNLARHMAGQHPEYIDEQT